MNTTIIVDKIMKEAGSKISAVQKEQLVEITGGTYKGYKGWYWGNHDGIDYLERECKKFG